MGERDGRERLGCDKKGRKERERAVSVRPSVRPSPPHNRPTGAFMHSARGLSGLGHNLGRLWRGRRRAADFHSEMAAPSVGNPMWSSSQAIAAAERREGERSCIRRRGEPCSSGLEIADSLFSGGRAGGEILSRHLNHFLDRHAKAAWAIGDRDRRLGRPFLHVQSQVAYPIRGCSFSGPRSESQCLSFGSNLLERVQRAPGASHCRRR